MQRTNGQFSDAQKFMARYHIILEDSKFATGDFARTQHMLANSFRILKAQIGDMAREIGDGFNPMLTKAVSALVHFFSSENEREIASYEKEVYDLVATFRQFAGIDISDQRSEMMAIHHALASAAAKGDYAAFERFVADWIRVRDNVDVAPSTRGTFTTFLAQWQEDWDAALSGAMNQRGIGEDDLLTAFFSSPRLTGYGPSELKRFFDKQIRDEKFTQAFRGNIEISLGRDSIFGIDDLMPTPEKLAWRLAQYKDVFESDLEDVARGAEGAASTYWKQSSIQ